MSIFYKKSNTESAKSLFDKSLVYDNRIKDPAYENLISFETTEKYLYGRVKRTFTPMEISPNLSLSSLSQTNESNNNLQAISFVVDAFNEMSNQFVKKVAVGQISTSDPNLSVLEVKKAYESPKGLYNKHLQTIRNSIVQEIKNKNLNFSNFQEFINIASPIILKMAKNVPFTYSGFIKSRYCPPTVSGLVIEIADADCSNDENKIRAFKNSPNWLFYLNTCKSYGFSVDTNVPWRLVADIGSAEMLEYASRYGYPTTDSILNVGYGEAQVTFVPLMRTILLEMYNLSKRQYQKIETCSDGTISRKIITPIEYNINNPDTLLSDIKTLQLYARIRMTEDESKFSDTDKQKMMTLLKQFYRMHGLQRACRELELIIAPTFNESGSLTDLLRRDKIRKQEEQDVLSNT